MILVKDILKNQLSIKISFISIQELEEALRPLRDKITLKENKVSKKY